MGLLEEQELEGNTWDQVLILCSNCISYSSTATSIIPSPSVGVKETYTLAIYDIQNQFIGKGM